MKKHFKNSKLYVYIILLIFTIIINYRIITSLARTDIVVTSGNVGVSAYISETNKNLAAEGTTVTDSWKFSDIKTLEIAGDFTNVTTNRKEIWVTLPIGMKFVSIPNERRTNYKCRYK